MPNDNALLLDALRAINDGDFSRTLDVSAGGEAKDLAVQINILLERLNLVAVEFTRIFREIGEGKYGGQAEVPELTGSWNELLMNLNFMSAKVTVQFRDIASVVDARANGNFQKRSLVPCAGEMEELQLTLNILGDQLACLTAGISKAAAERQTLDLQSVPGLAGGFKQISDDVLSLAK